MWAEGAVEGPAVEDGFRGGGVLDDEPDFAEGLIISLLCDVGDLLERMDAQGGKQQRGGGVSQSEKCQGNGDDQSAGPDDSEVTGIQDVGMVGADTIQ